MQPLPPTCHTCRRAKQTWCPALERGCLTSSFQGWAGRSCSPAGKSLTCNSTMIAFEHLTEHVGSPTDSHYTFSNHLATSVGKSLTCNSTMIAFEHLTEHAGSPTDSHYTFASALTTWPPVSVKVWHAIQPWSLSSIWPNMQAALGTRTTHSPAL